MDVKILISKRYLSKNLIGLNTPGTLKTNPGLTIQRKTLS